MGCQKCPSGYVVSPITLWHPRDMNAIVVQGHGWMWLGADLCLIFWGDSFRYVGYN